MRAPCPPETTLLTWNTSLWPETPTPRVSPPRLSDNAWIACEVENCADGSRLSSGVVAVEVVSDQSCTTLASPPVAISVHASSIARERTVPFVWKTASSASCTPPQAA